MPKKPRREAAEDKKEEVDEEEAIADRDYVMARLGGALASLAAAKGSVEEALALFVNPDDDDEGEERREMLDNALEAAGAASRGIEDAIDRGWESGEAAFDVGEPWDDET